MLRVQAGVVSDKASLHKWSPSCHARTEERVSRALLLLKGHHAHWLGYQRMTSFNFSYLPTHWS